MDVRRKRPPALSFLLRAQTLRNVVRIATLLALDFAGLFAAIFTALMVKAVIRDGDWAWHASFEEAKSLIAFAYLVTALLFARSGLYAERAQRPGLPKIVTSLFQCTVVALIYAVVSGEQYSSYYIFYGTLFFAIVYVGCIRWAYEKVTGVLLRAAGYRRRALLVGSGHHIEDVAHALADEVHAPVEMVGFISLDPAPRQRPALARPDRGPRRRCSTPSASRRSSSPTPTSRRARRSSSSTSATSAASRCGSRPRRWRSSSTARSSCRGRRCRCSSCARRCSTASTTRSSARSTSSARSACWSCSARCCC